MYATEYPSRSIAAQERRTAWCSNAEVIVALSSGSEKAELLMTQLLLSVPPEVK